jgi:hypothetical protein
VLLSFSLSLSLSVSHERGGLRAANGYCGRHGQLRRADALAAQYQAELEQARHDRTVSVTEAERLRTALATARQAAADIQVQYHRAAVLLYVVVCVRARTSLVCI